MTKDTKARREDSCVSPYHSPDPIDRDRPRKVALVAYGETNHLAPFADPDWEIWGLNAVGHYMEEMRFHWMFDLHPYHFGCATVNRLEKAEWYHRWGGPVYMAEPSEMIANSVAYPLDDVATVFARLTKGQNWYASTHAYMIALAIQQGFRTIGLYGFEFYTAKELSDQRACAHWYLGYAAANGIQIICPESDNTILQHDHLYGYEDDPTEAFTPENIAKLLNGAGSRLNELARIVSRMIEDKAAQDGS